MVFVYIITETIDLTIWTTKKVVYGIYSLFYSPELPSDYLTPEEIAEFREYMKKKHLKKKVNLLNENI